MPNEPQKETFKIAERIARHYLDSERVSVTQFSDIATAIEKELDRYRDEIEEIRHCDKCDLCEDHHAD